MVFQEYASAQGTGSILRTVKTRYDGIFRTVKTRSDGILTTLGSCFVRILANFPQFGVGGIWE